MGASDQASGAATSREEEPIGMVGLTRMEITGKEIRRYDRIYYGGTLAGIADADAAPQRTDHTKEYLKIFLSGGYCDVFYVTAETKVQVERRV
jgi:hypothetical protein